MVYTWFVRRATRNTFDWARVSAKSSPGDRYDALSAYVSRLDGSEQHQHKVWVRACKGQRDSFDARAYVCCSV